MVMPVEGPLSCFPEPEEAVDDPMRNITYIFERSDEGIVLQDEPQDAAVHADAAKLSFGGSLPGRTVWPPTGYRR